jgi:antitoxin component of MazEF toxin-antitoxin module
MMNPCLDQVRVTRNGNSRTLSIPVEIVEQQGIETGEVYCVEASPDTIVYRRLRASTPWKVIGEGAERYVVLSPEAMILPGPDPSPRPPLDWDY